MNIKQEIEQTNNTKSIKLLLLKNKREMKVSKGSLWYTYT